MWATKAQAQTWGIWLDTGTGTLHTSSPVGTSRRELNQF